MLASMHVIRLIVPIFMLMHGISSAYCGEYPPQEPILRVNPDMHTAVIRRLAADYSCNLLATSSEDKTVRLWGMPEGRLINTIRPPIGPGNNGKVYAVAVAPDGSWTAAGGWTRTGGDHWVQIFQNATGAMTARMGSFAQVIEHLSVSSDGRFLAATFRGGQGVRVWERKGVGLARWELVGEDTNYNGTDAYGAAFDKDGFLYTVSYDGRIRRYSSRSWGTPQVGTTHGGKRPYSIAIHPKEDRLAVGFSDTSAVDVYDSTTLSWSFAADTSSVQKGNLNAVAWSLSGDLLFAGGTFQRDSVYMLLVWSQAGKGPPKEISGPSDAILNLTHCGDGIAFAAGDPAFGVLKEDGSPIQWRGPVTVDMRGKLGPYFTVSGDGSRVRFGLGPQGDQPVMFDLLKEELVEASPGSEELTSADTHSLPVTEWPGHTPKLSNDPIVLDKFERAQSLALSARRHQVVLGTDFNIRSYDDEGILLWKQQAPGVAWGVNIAKNGKVVVAALGDGTIRWYRIEDGQQLLSLFVHAKSKRWIAWTPKGYYTASAGGENLVGWHLNRSWSEAGDWYPASKFRDTFLRPDIVTRILTDLDEESAISNANNVSKRKRDQEDIRRRQPPIIRITSPADPFVTSEEEISVEYNVRSPSGLAVTRITVVVDGERFPVALPKSGDTNTALTDFVGSTTARVPNKDITISLIAQTESGESSSLPIRIRRLGVLSKPIIKPRLFALLIGVGKYDMDELKLAFPTKDVSSLEAALEGQKGKAFRDVMIKKLTDRDMGVEATRDNIQEQASWLRQSTNDPNDAILFFFSGHGKSVVNGSSYLLPVDYNGNHDTRGIEKKWLLSTLKQTNAKILIFVDACFAADGLNTVDFVNENLNWDGIRAISFASSSRHERSYGNDANSYYTAALVEGFLGWAPHTDRTSIFSDELQVYLKRRVKQLAEPKKQTPIMSASPNWEDFPLVVVR